MQQLAADRLVAKGKAPVRIASGDGLSRRLADVSSTTSMTSPTIASTWLRGMLGLTVAVRSVPRSQVRSDLDEGLLRPVRCLHQFGGTQGFAVVGRAGERRRSMWHFEKKLHGLEKAAADYRVKYKKELAEKNRKYRDELQALQTKVDAFKANSPLRRRAAWSWWIARTLATPASCCAAIRGAPARSRRANSCRSSPRANRNRSRTAAAGLNSPRPLPTRIIP